MKKILFALIAVWAMTGCSKNEVIEENQEIISFGNIFIDNITKAVDPSYGVNNPLSLFNIYGYVEGVNTNVAIFEGEEVTGTVGEGSIWECEKKQYWIPKASYKFTALVDMPQESITMADLLPETLSYSATSQKDILYASASAVGELSGNDPVELIFEHLLSKVLFTFNNIDGSATLTVSDIQISGLYLNGKYSISNGNWAENTEAQAEFVPNFGGAANIEPGKDATCDNERLVIPGTYDITITFKVNDNKGGQEQPIEAEINDFEFKRGHAYNFTADIKSGLKFIEFTITSTDWEESDTNIQA